MKKIASFLVACSMVLGLAGCAGSPVSSSAAGAGSSAAGSAAASTAGSAASAEGMKIVFVSSPSGVDDGSFVQNSYEGVLNFIDSRGSIDTVTDIVEPPGDTTAAVQAVADVIADYDVIVTPGFQFAGIGTLAQENPDKQFILIDTVATDESGNVAELDNVTSLIFAEEEGGFFAGLAAALTTKTGKVASVHGVAFESNVNYQYGFECGVKYVNETDSATVAQQLLPYFRQGIFVHASMRRGNSRTRHQLTQLSSGAVQRINPVVNIIRLTAAVQLTAQRLRNNPRVMLQDIGFHRAALKRRLFNGGHITKPAHRHTQRSRNGRCRKREHIDADKILFQLLFMFHTETLLFVDDDKAQIFKMHAFLQKLVRSNHQINRTVGQSFQHRLLLCGRRKA